MSPRARIAAAVAGTVAAVAAWAAAVVAARWARLGLASARFVWRLATLGAYRRCPDCRRLMRREARVCRGCGARVRR